MRASITLKLRPTDTLAYAAQCIRDLRVASVDSPVWIEIEQATGNGWETVPVLACEVENGNVTLMECGGEPLFYRRPRIMKDCIGGDTLHSWSTVSACHYRDY